MLNFGANEVMTPQEILSSAPNSNVNANANVNEEEGSAFEEYFPTVYKAIWGKDTEEQLIAAETRLQYIMQAVAIAPGTQRFVQTEIDRLEKEIASLKKKALAAKIRRWMIVGIPSSLTVATIYYLVKRANK